MIPALTMNQQEQRITLHSQVQEEAHSRLQLLSPVHPSTATCSRARNAQDVASSSDCLFPSARANLQCTLVAQVRNVAREFADRLLLTTACGWEAVNSMEAECVQAFYIALTVRGHSRVSFAASV